MLRITPDAARGLQLEGRLTRFELGLLRETLHAASRGHTRLDLSRLRFVDEAGAAALRELEGRGLELVGGSAFVRQLLREGAA
jgi:ABC-type transporter Mla MlaB component